MSVIREATKGMLLLLETLAIILIMGNTGVAVGTRMMVGEEIRVVMLMQLSVEILEISMRALMMLVMVSDRITEVTILDPLTLNALFIAPVKVVVAVEVAVDVAVRMAVEVVVSLLLLTVPRPLLRFRLIRRLCL